MHRTTPAIAALLCASAVASSAQTAHAHGCSDAATFERRVVCLVNDERRHHGRGALDTSANLHRAADGHAADMVARRYFSHRTPEGAGPADRARRAGYPSGRRRWMVGEALAYATGGLASPRAIVASWMRSPAHRAVVLLRGARHVAAGAVRGTPTTGHGVTVALEVGRRG